MPKIILLKLGNASIKMQIQSHFGLSPPCRKMPQLIIWLCATFFTRCLLFLYLEWNDIQAYLIYRLCGKEIRFLLEVLLQLHWSSQVQYEARRGWWRGEKRSFRFAQFSCADVSGCASAPAADCLRAGSLLLIVFFSFSIFKLIFWTLTCRSAAISLLLWKSKWSLK